MAPIERADWGPGGESRAVVPTDDLPAPGQVVAEIEAQYPLPVTSGLHDVGRSAPDSADPVAVLGEHKLEAAAYAATQILGENPDPGFIAKFDELSPNLQAKVFAVMAGRPHLRGLDLVDAVERKLTLAEAVEAKEWVSNLSKEHRALLRGEGA